MRATTEFRGRVSSVRFALLVTWARATLRATHVGAACQVGEHADDGAGFQRLPGGGPGQAVVAQRELDARLGVKRQEVVS